MKKIFYILLAILFPSIQLFAEEISLSLTDAVDSALANNQKIAQQQEVVFQKEYLNKAAFGNYLPSVNLIAGYTYLNKNPEINMEKMKESIDNVAVQYAEQIASDLGTPLTPQEIDLILAGLGEIPSYNIEIDQQKYKNANLLITQPIFMGGEITAGKRFAKSEFDFAKEELNQTRDQITQQTIERYLSIALLERVLAVRKNVVSGMLKHERDAQKAVDVGLIPPHEIIRAQVAVANAERKLTDTKNKLTLANSALKTLLNLPRYTQFTLSDSLKYYPIDIELTECNKRARSNNSILKLIAQKQIMAEQAFNLERAKFLPKILAVGEYNIIRNNYPMVLPAYSVGLQMEINLFGGLKKYNKLQYARHLRSEVSKAKKYATEEILLLTEKYYNEVSNSQTRYMKLKPTVELAKKNLQINEKRFYEGLGKSIDVIDSRLLYQAAQVEQLLSLFDYYKALSKLYLTIEKSEQILEMFDCG
ncbi:MAG: TolC family protein [Candidatus Cloacimonadota bacterium]|nr:TolC family protein [Candidatus Cloacimonadota bacterium]